MRFLRAFGTLAPDRSARVRVTLDVNGQRLGFPLSGGCGSPKLDRPEVIDFSGT
jgi:hypothetical protein